MVVKKIWLIAAMLPILGCTQAKEESTRITKPVEQNILSQRVKKQGSIPGNPNQDTNQAAAIRGKESKTINAIQGKEISKPVRKPSVMLDVELIPQLPELKYGCEVTSTAMMLKFAGVDTNKMDLYYLIKKDPDPLVKSRNGDILRWGSPADGFVGDMTGKQPGYAAFEQPMMDLINKKLPGRAVNLTNKPFEELLTHVSRGLPVVIWTTGDYRLPNRWEGWHHGSEYIKTPLDLHVVLLVGYDSGHVYINDPLSGKKQAKVNKDQFIASWKALKSRAVSYQ